MYAYMQGPRQSVGIIKCWVIEVWIHVIEVSLYNKL